MDRTCYREDGYLENYGYVEQLIQETANSASSARLLRKLLHQTMKFMKPEKHLEKLLSHLLLECLELCLIYSNPNCLGVVLDLVDEINIMLNLKASHVTVSFTIKQV